MQIFRNQENRIKPVKKAEEEPATGTRAQGAKWRGVVLPPERWNLPIIWKTLKSPLSFQPLGGRDRRTASLRSPWINYIARLYLKKQKYQSIETISKAKKTEIRPPYLPR